MTFAGSLLLIDNTSVPGLKDYEVNYVKVWKDQTENMAGNFRATLLGLKAEISLTFGGDLREDDVSSLANRLNQDYFEVTFFDPNSKTVKTANYYTSDINLKLIDKLKGRYDFISIDLKPVSRYV
jgi:hypothetical protein